MTVCYFACLHSYSSLNKHQPPPPPKSFHTLFSSSTETVTINVSTLLFILRCALGARYFFLENFGETFSMTLTLENYCKWMPFVQQRTFLTRNGNLHCRRHDTHWATVGLMFQRWYDASLCRIAMSKRTRTVPSSRERVTRFCVL